MGMHDSVAVALADLASLEHERIARNAERERQRQLATEAAAERARAEAREREARVRDEADARAREAARADAERVEAELRIALLRAEIDRVQGERNLLHATLSQRTHESLTAASPRPRRAAALWLIAGLLAVASAATVALLWNGQSARPAQPTLAPATVVMVAPPALPAAGQPAAASTVAHVPAATAPTTQPTSRPAVRPRPRGPGGADRDGHGRRVRDDLGPLGDTEGCGDDPICGIPRL